MTGQDDNGRKTARLWLKIDLGERGQIGPGKIALLKRIGACGSISAAARDLGMSYRRAWLLIDALNRNCGKQVVVTATGGREHGGAQLTPAGLALISLYERICEKAQSATAADLEELTG